MYAEWGVCAGSDLKVLGNYFKYFCLYVAFITCVVIAFKVSQNTIEYWASFSITVFSLKKKSIGYSPFSSMYLPGKEREHMF